MGFDKAGKESASWDESASTLRIKFTEQRSNATRPSKTKLRIAVRVHCSGAVASNPFSMKPDGVDAGVGHCGKVRERQRPAS